MEIVAHNAAIVIKREITSVISAHFRGESHM